MALFINEQTSSLADFMTKLDAFLTTAGAGNPAWTAEDVDGGGNSLDTAAGEWAISKAAAGTNTNDIQISAAWDTATPDNLALYQYNHASGAGNYDNTRAGPWDQNGDSGNGYYPGSLTNANIATHRYVEITNTPVQYWAFTGQSPVEYVYVVVEVSTGEYRHFGFGELEKFNDWDGGAFCYGWLWQTTSSQVAIQPNTSVLLDGFYKQANNDEFAPTINIENLPGQTGDEMWAIVTGAITGTFVQDRQNNDGVTADQDRGFFQGGFRAGIGAGQYGMFGASSVSGFVPGYPIECFYLDKDATPDQWYGPMGVMDGVRGVNIGQFAPTDEVVIGSDTWTMFPSKRKDAGNVSGSSANQGIMYRQNT